MSDGDPRFSEGDEGDAPVGPALREAVAGVRFPVTKDALARQAGDAAIPAGGGVSVPLREVLRRAPGRLYDSVDELEDDVDAALRRGQRE